MTILLFVGTLAALFVITRARSCKVRLLAWMFGLICLIVFLALVGMFH